MAHGRYQISLNISNLFLFTFFVLCCRLVLGELSETDSNLYRRWQLRISLSVTRSIIIIISRHLNDFTSFDLVGAALSLSLSDLCSHHSLLVLAPSQLLPSPPLLLLIQFQTFLNIMLFALRLLSRPFASLVTFFLSFSFRCSTITVL